MRAVFFVAFLLATVAFANALIKPHCKCITDPCPCEDPEVPRKLVKRAGKFAICLRHICNKRGIFKSYIGKNTNIFSGNFRMLLNARGKSEQHFDSLNTLPPNRLKIIRHYCTVYGTGWSEQYGLRYELVGTVRLAVRVGSHSMKYSSGSTFSIFGTSTPVLP